MKNIGLYPRVHADADGAAVVSQAGGLALVETARAVGLDRALSQSLGRWRKRLARHDPGKVITDLAITLALGGDCLADIALLRADRRSLVVSRQTRRSRKRSTRWQLMRRGC